MIRSVQVYSVTVEVLVEATSPDEAKTAVEKAVETMDEGELYATELGPAVLSEAATREWRKAHGLPAEDLRSWAVREDTRY